MKTAHPECLTKQGRKTHQSPEVKQHTARHHKQTATARKAKELDSSDSEEEPATDKEIAAVLGDQPSVE